MELPYTAGDRYDADYFGTSKLSPPMRSQHEVQDGEGLDEAMNNVFRMDGGKIRHFWGR